MAGGRDVFSSYYGGAEGRTLNDSLSLPTAAPSSLPFLYQLTQLFRRIQKATLSRLYPLAAIRD